MYGGQQSAFVEECGPGEDEDADHAQDDQLVSMAVLGEARPGRRRCCQHLGPLSCAREGKTVGGETGGGRVMKRMGSGEDDEEISKGQEFRVREDATGKEAVDERRGEWIRWNVGGPASCTFLGFAR